MENIIWLVNNKEIIDLFVKFFFFLEIIISLTGYGSTHRG